MDTKPEYDYAEDVTFKVYELTEGIAAKTQVYNTRAELELSISVLKEGNTITVSVQHFGDAKPYKVYLHAVKNIASVTGGTGQEAEKGTVIIPSEYKKDSVEVISCKLY